MININDTRYNNNELANNNNNYNNENQEEELNFADHPHTKQAIIPAILAMIAFSLVYYGTTIPCIFVNSHINYNSGLEDDMGLGFYSYELNDYCYSLSSDYRPNSYLEAARVFSVLTLLLGGVGTISVCLLLCLEVTTFEVNASAIILFSASICSGLSLLILKSDLCENSIVVVGQVLSSKCELNTGCKCAISAMVLWFFASVSNIFVFHSDIFSVVSEDSLLRGVEESSDDEHEQSNMFFNLDNTITVPLLMA